MRYLYLFVLLILASCTKEDIRRNPYIFPVQFSISINTNLPKYTGLSTPPKAVFISQEGSGIKGIILVAISPGNYKAWEASDPNHLPSECKKTIQIQGLTAVCECSNESITYSLITGEVISGQSNKPLFPLVEYRVTVTGSVLTIYN